MKASLAIIFVGASTLSLALSPAVADPYSIEYEWPTHSSTISNKPRQRQTGPSPQHNRLTESEATQGDVVPAIRSLPPDPGHGQAYRIGPHDLLQIEVFQVEELSSEERVGEDGRIILPLIGPIMVGGLTPAQAEATIAEALGRDYLQDPQVNIYVSEYASQRVTVLGSVNKPGVFPLTGRTTLLQAIAMAQGLGRVAQEEEVVLFRADAKGTIAAYVVDLEKVQQGQLRDPVLVGDDRVFVPESGSEVFIKGLSDTLRGFVRLPLY